MIVEMRRYTIRSGCMRDMHARMKDVLIPLFQEHGMPNPLAIWQTHTPADKLVMTWMLNWPSYEERRSSWLRFRPIWEAAKRARSAEEFVTRTDLTLIEAWPSHPLSFPPGADVCEAAWAVQPRVGFGGAFRTACLELEFENFAAAGASSVVACDYLFGPLPQSLILLSWADSRSRAEGIDRLSQRPLTPSMAAAIGAESSIVASGSWERIDRASYLRTWQSSAGLR
jgi:hypothetical protein